GNGVGFFWSTARVAGLGKAGTVQWGNSSSIQHSAREEQTLGTSAHTHTQHTHTTTQPQTHNTHTHNRNPHTHTNTHRHTTHTHKRSFTSQQGRRCPDAGDEIGSFIY